MSYVSVLRGIRKLSLVCDNTFISKGSSGLSAGVIQGSVLCPLLFLRIIMNDLHSNIKLLAIMLILDH